MNKSRLNPNLDINLDFLSYKRVLNYMNISHLYYIQIANIHIVVVNHFTNFLI